MASTTKPTFVLVPGTFHTAAHAELLVEALHAKGYPTKVISHPTIGPLATTAPPDADITHLRQVLEDLINDQQKEVILFCHSYGGVPGCQSVHGLERSARATAGLQGGIVKIIFLSAILSREGESTLETLAAAEIPQAEWMEIDMATGTSCANSKATAILFHDLPADQAEHWASKLEVMSAKMVAAPASNVCWGTHVPKVSIFCKRDRVFPLSAQRRMLERIQGDKRGDWETYELDCGHSPFLSHVEDLVQVLTKV